MFEKSFRYVGFFGLAFVCAGSLSACDLVERGSELAGIRNSTPSGEESPDEISKGVVSRSDRARVQQNQGRKSPPAHEAPVQPLAPLPAGVPLSFADLASASDAGVVFVRTVQSSRRGRRRVLGEASGSGFVFDPNGKVLTNYHVVKGAHAIMVEFKDGRGLMAEVIAQDPLTDLAILQVKAKNLSALPLGDSDAIRVGDWVIAIGNPYGLEHTVSAGIISAKERTGRDVHLGNEDAYYSFLQTDASINPGNSGGPLLDLAGHVVGINTAINQEANSIGFAIPINMIKRLLPRLLRDGIIKRAAIGVQVADVSAEDVERLKLSDRRGAYIARVLKRGPAGRAGLQAGDVVVDFDGHNIDTPSELRWQASLAIVGEKVNIAVIREGVRQVLTIRPAPLRLR